MGYGTAGFNVERKSSSRNQYCVSWTEMGKNSWRLMNLNLLIAFYQLKLWFNCWPVLLKNISYFETLKLSGLLRLIFSLNNSATLPHLNSGSSRFHKDPTSIYRFKFILQLQSAESRASGRSDYVRLWHQLRVLRKFQLRQLRLWHRLHRLIFSPGVGIDKLRKEQKICSYSYKLFIFFHP